MNAVKALALLEKYGKCENCGSELFGNGKGELEVTDDTFMRSCKCGWKVEIKDEETA